MVRWIQMDAPGVTNNWSNRDNFRHTVYNTALPMRNPRTDSVRLAEAAIVIRNTHWEDRAAWLSATRSVWATL